MVITACQSAAKCQVASISPKSHVIKADVIKADYLFDISITRLNQSFLDLSPYRGQSDIQVDFLPDGPLPQIGQRTMKRGQDRMKSQTC
jgi:hypothetical protein